MNLTLRPAKIVDLAKVLKWVPDAKACLMWAGPGIRYPASTESAWEDMEASGENTFCLVKDSGEMVGFGQILPRGSSVMHMAQIIVDPADRGRGYGRILCVKLMEEAEKRFSVRRFTLNVYESNKAAIQLYRSLGFTEQVQQRLEGILAMERPVGIFSFFATNNRQPSTNIVGVNIEFEDWEKIREEKN